MIEQRVCGPSNSPFDTIDAASTPNQLSAPRPLSLAPRDAPISPNAKLTLIVSTRVVATGGEAERYQRQPFDIVLRRRRMADAPDEAKNPQANSLQPAFDVNTSNNTAEPTEGTAEPTEGSASTPEPGVAASKRPAVDRTTSLGKKPRNEQDPWLVDPFAKKYIKALGHNIVEFVQRYLRKVRAEAVTDISGGEAAGVDAEVADEMCFDMKTVLDPADALVFNSTDSIRSSISKLSLLRSGLRNVVSEAVAASVDGDNIWIPQLRLDTMYEIDEARLGITVLASGARHGAGVLELGRQVGNAVDRRAR
eukprot:m.424457 g.424457  ORF g.424457 m.424457 type:complete len:308 (-) comp16856_c0_seq61:2365-3288(-)